MTRFSALLSTLVLTAAMIVTGCSGTATGPDQNGTMNGNNNGTTGSNGKNWFTMNGDGYSNTTFRATIPILTSDVNNGVLLYGYGNGLSGSVSLLWWGRGTGQYTMNSTNPYNLNPLTVNVGNTNYTVYEGKLTVTRWDSHIAGKFTATVINQYTAAAATVTGEFDIPL